MDVAVGQTLGPAGPDVAAPAVRDLPLAAGVPEKKILSRSGLGPGPKSGSLKKAHFLKISRPQLLGSATGLNQSSINK